MVGIRVGRVYSPTMRKVCLFTLLFVFLWAAPAVAEDTTACAPKYKAIIDHARVTLKGEGDLDITILTDPLCWHCRLGHKLLREYPEKYRTMKFAFFPRRNFIGSDMACWILEDAVGSAHLEAMIDYAYTDLKQPKTKDLMEARLLILIQFTKQFPHLLQAGSIESLFVRLQKEQEARVTKAAALGRISGMPGTPVLLAGQNAVIGYGAKQWLKALDEKAFCQ